jgi:hypothetical protein
LRVALAVLLFAEVFGFYLLLAGRLGAPALVAAAAALLCAALLVTRRAMPTRSHIAPPSPAAVRLGGGYGPARDHAGRRRREAKPCAQARM